MTILARSQNPSADPPRTFSAPQGSASVHLDALRGLAAFSVFLVHWRIAFFVESAQIAKPSLLTSIADCFSSLGQQWVMVFFVLSGYLVGGSVLRNMHDGRWSWREYLLARLSRLYIVLLPALVLGAAFDRMGMNLPGSELHYGLHGGVGAVILNARLNLTLPVFLANVSFLQCIPWHGLAGGMMPTFGSNIPLWSLTYEFWYYMAFPVLVLALSPRQSRRARLACTLALILWVWFVGERITLFSIPWLMGVAIRTLPAFPALRAAWARRAVIGAAIALFTAGLVVSRSNPTWFMQILVAEGAAMLVWVLLGCASGKTPGWYNRLAQRAARSSYTLYLIHTPFLVFLKTALHLPLFQPSWGSLVPTLAVMAVILIYAQLVYEFFEKHTDQVRGWIMEHWMGRPMVVAQAFSRALPPTRGKPVVSAVEAESLQSAEAEKIPA